MVTQGAKANTNKQMSFSTTIISLRFEAIIFLQLYRYFIAFETISKYINVFFLDSPIFYSRCVCLSCLGYSLCHFHQVPAVD